jgi:hypothetical protein
VPEPVIDKYDLLAAAVFGTWSARYANRANITGIRLSIV